MVLPQFSLDLWWISQPKYFEVLSELVWRPIRSVFLWDDLSVSLRKPADGVSLACVAYNGKWQHN